MSEVSLVAIVGVAVAAMSIAIKLIGFPDQFRRNLKRRSTEGVSFLFYAMSFITYALWGFYGWLKGDWVIILAQGILGCLTTGLILFQFFHYRNEKHTEL